MGGRGSGGRKSGSGRGSSQSTFQTVAYERASEMLESSFIRNNVPSELAAEISGSIARDRGLEYGEDATTVFRTYTANEQRQLSQGYSTTLQEYGYSGEISVRKVKVAGSKSRLKGGYSTGATYETRVSFNYRR